MTSKDNDDNIVLDADENTKDTSVVQLSDVNATRIESSQKLRHYIVYLYTYNPQSSSQDKIRVFAGQDQDFTKSEHEKNSLERRLRGGTRFRVATTKAANKVNHAIEHVWKDVDRIIDQSKSMEHWMISFRSLRGQEVLKSSKCKLYNSAPPTGITGFLYITLTHFCFTHLHWTHAYRPHFVFIKIPLTHITAVTKAGRKYHHDKVNGKKPPKTRGPEIVPLSQRKVKPSVIQIWSNQGFAHQFYSFGPDFDSVWDILSTNWFFENKSNTTHKDLGLI